MNHKFYTPREAAEILKISPTTVMKLIHSEQLMAVRVSEKIYRVPHVILDRYIEVGGQFKQIDPKTIKVGKIDKFIDAHEAPPIRKNKSPLRTPALARG